MNSYIKLVDIILACILMFMLPAFYFSQKNDSLSQQLLAEYTRVFAENVQTQGRLTKQMYEDYLQQLNGLPFSCEIEMEHIKYCREPVYEKGIAGENVFTGAVIRYYDTVYTEVILQKVYSRQDNYQFEQQDIFNIRVRNKSQSLAGVILQELTGIQIEGNIYAACGGKIRNNQN